ncbi:hypothetical protein [Actinomadura bangladeshensis]|uniref:Uncharacterized protein n=1 Tax=Actinomadura bangladeshensis TaxID=453573 RepID=A0A4R4N9N1_9ACTN|nr:hypothetical protein [Actinomadura bangladeshensis]TDC04844.1 hypothetical protein E1284_36310 [Actinomadura bangladeshensis]
MRFKGVHRKPRDQRTREAPHGGRFRADTARDERRQEVAYAPSPPDSGQVRPRSNQPRDRFGRFRKAGRDDDFAVPGPDAAGTDAVDTAGGPRGLTGRLARRVHRPRAADYSWSDFELEDDRVRVEPYPPGMPHAADGRRNCGVLESVLVRQWDVRDGPPTPEVIGAVDSLASLPEPLKEKLAAGLDGIYVGPGGVPQLDDMGHLRDRPLPSGRATWDICAGAYGDRKIVVGDRPSPTPDVMLHEVGHALDDIDGDDGEWTSDSPAFRKLYEECRPYLASAFHKQPDALGRREFFADAFAAISSRQRPALVDMLAGNIRTALEVMLFFNRRYGI